MNINDIPQDIKDEIIRQALIERGRQNEAKKREKPGYTEKQSRAGKIGMAKRWGTREIKAVLK